MPYTSPAQVGPQTIGQPGVPQPQQGLLGGVPPWLQKLMPMLQQHFAGLGQFPTVPRGVGGQGPNINPAPLGQPSLPGAGPNLHPSAIPQLGQLATNLGFGRMTY
jgi:hypothetical protein